MPPTTITTRRSAWVRSHKLLASFSLVCFSLSSSSLVSYSPFSPFPLTFPLLTLSLLPSFARLALFLFFSRRKGTVESAHNRSFANSVLPSPFLAPYFSSHSSFFLTYTAYFLSSLFLTICACIFSCRSFVHPSINWQLYVHHLLRRRPFPQSAPPFLQMLPLPFLSFPLFSFPFLFDFVILRYISRALGGSAHSV